MSMEIKLGELARLVGGELEGNPDHVVADVAGLDTAGPEHLAFLADRRYLAQAKESRAGAILIPRDLDEKLPGATIRVDNPYAAFLVVLKARERDSVCPPVGLHPTAHIDPDAGVADGIGIGACVVVEAGAEIAAGTVLWPGVYVGHKVRIGHDCILHPGVHVARDVVMGDRVILQPGCVIGSDGFGYVTSAEGHSKIPHVGTVEIGDDVEIGANSTIDRGTVGSTRIESGAKIDNLVHVAHNAVIRSGAMLAAQVGVSGSSKVGVGAVMGGQSGMAGHLEVGDGARVAARGAVTKSIQPGATVSGHPAMDHGRAKRLQGHIRRLPAMQERLKELEDRLRRLEESREKIT